MNVPDTAHWYHLAYMVATLVYVGYIASLWWRKR